MFNNITTNQRTNLYYDMLTFKQLLSRKKVQPTAMDSSSKPFHHCWLKPQVIPPMLVQVPSPPISVGSSFKSSHFFGFKPKLFPLLWVQAPSSPTAVGASPSPPIAVCPSPKPSQSCGFKSQALPTLLIKLQVISVMGLSPKSSHCCGF